MRLSFLTTNGEVSRLVRTMPAILAAYMSMSVLCSGPYATMQCLVSSMSALKARMLAVTASFHRPFLSHTASGCKWGTLHAMPSKETLRCQSMCNGGQAHHCNREHCREEARHT